MTLNYRLDLWFGTFIGLIMENQTIRASFWPYVAFAANEMCFLFLYKAQQCYRRFDCFLTNSQAFYLLNLTLSQFLDNSQVTRSEVKKLIWLLTKDNLEATHHLNRLISDKILMAVRGHHTHPDLVDSVRHEMSLLRVTVAKDDSCWEERIKCVIRQPH